MLKNDIQKTAANGWVCGNHPEGCNLCIHGSKIVYFMGGDCSLPPHCNWYCPISAERKPASAHFVDEIPIPNPDSLEETVKILQFETHAVGAHGMSLTGGDPLSSSRKVDWACAIIQSMKALEGNDFHIHLYTSGVTFNSLTADKLDKAGLDDLRFHPSEEDFSKIELAIGHRYTVAAEVPVVPTEENHQYLLRLADYLETIGADFMNLNEFEMCDANRDELLKRGFKLVKGTAATVKDSAEYAERFLKEFKRKTLTINFCSVKIKDQVQIRSRYLHRAKNIKLPYEEISRDGCLLYLRIEGSPQTLKKLHRELQDESQIPSKMMGYDPVKGFLDLPEFLAENEDFIHQISEFHIKAGVYEVLPFRDPKLAEIREYTPIINNL